MERSLLKRHPMIWTLVGVACVSLVACKPVTEGGGTESGTGTEGGSGTESASSTSSAGTTGTSAGSGGQTGGTSTGAGTSGTGTTATTAGSSSAGDTAGSTAGGSSTGGTGGGSPEPGEIYGVCGGEIVCGAGACVRKPLEPAPGDVDCMKAPMDTCPLYQVCVMDKCWISSWSVCTNPGGCSDPQVDCPPAPATGTATPFCGVAGGGCGLDCSGGETCPDGMGCAPEGWCAWPPA